MLAQLPHARLALIGTGIVGIVTVMTLLVQGIALSQVLTTHTRGAALVFVVALLIRVTLLVSSEPLTMMSAQRIVRSLRTRVLERDPATVSAEEFVNLTMRGADSLATYLATYLPALAVAVAAPVVVLAWLAMNDWLSAVIVGATLLALPITMALQGLAARDAMATRWHDQQRLARYLSDLIRGMGTLRAYRREHRALDGLDRANEAWTASTLATLRVAFLSSFSLELLASLATALVALVLGVRLIHGHLHLATALAVLIVTPEAYLPLRRAAARFHAGQEGLAAMHELVRGHDAIPPATTIVRAPFTLRAQDVVVGHGTPDSQRGPFTLTIAPGDLVALVGPSGSGKSTLLAALVGLRAIESGALTVNGRAVETINRLAWHEDIGWMAQHPVLTGATVREAVTVGRAHHDDDVRRALQRAALDLPLNHEIGDEGRALSAGQRRRLALARALVSEPQLLVLDEPLAHLDDDTARALADTLRTTGITTVLATHRPLDGARVYDVGRSVST